LSHEIVANSLKRALNARSDAALLLQTSFGDKVTAASIASQASPFYALSLQEWGDKDSIQMYICASCTNIFLFSLDKRNSLRPWMRAGRERSLARSGWKKSTQLTLLFAERIQLLCAEVLIFCHAYTIFMQSAVLIRLKHQRAALLLSLVGART
jgi:hypothetical protein